MLKNKNNKPEKMDGKSKDVRNLLVKRAPVAIVAMIFLTGVSFSLVCEKDCLLKIGEGGSSAQHFYEPGPIEHPFSGKSSTAILQTLNLSDLEGFYVKVTV